MQLAVRVLYQRCAALYPVAVVALEDTVDFSHLGVMDMTATHGIRAAFACRLCDKYVPRSSAG